MCIRYSGSHHTCLSRTANIRPCTSTLRARQPQSRPTCKAITSQLMQLADVADLASTGGVVGMLLPGLGILGAGVAALRFYVYSQLEVITAKMLSKYIPSGGAKGAQVIQLGGGTRELYYYPKDIVLVINVGEKVNKGLMEQAGVTAAVPTLAKQQPVTDLSFQPDSSVDAVVALGVLCNLPPQQQQQCIQQISRILKPGMPLVFVEPLAEGGSFLRSVVGVSAGAGMPVQQLTTLQDNPAFSFVQWDTALDGQDPHAVGVAVRSEKSFAAHDDAAGPESRRRRKQPKAAKGFS